MASRTTFLAINFLYLVIVGSMVYAAYHYGGEASIVSLVIGVPTLVMILFAIGYGFLNSSESAVEPAASEEAATAPWSRAALIGAWLVGFLLLIFFIGFYKTIPIFALGYLKIQGKTSWVIASVTAGILWAVLYLSFDYLMGQELFQGILFKALVPNL
ncbi:MAG: hypothetical protein OEN50_19485 [Deltaproteobacteria bacterium]|nr:hypothetical protein [Deltaproteobacteria bacterium]